ncbi:Agmatine coumaroyltransferase-2 [Dichanthelium oligosanthes]|uniref:Agmatine coumaroyltransferase-2 n=1 Tax=Dichanthelium oligosanthes TaxID=888268 RepID=A0A1E5W395_9POAL|nr:Agmatine coumaroyltransferase-2 [Dichanthelium oligosanthes]
MKITVQSSKAVKPEYGADAAPFAAAGAAVPLTVFDKASFDEYISGINFFRPPAPPNAVLEAGLARALAEYREWAGRLGADAGGSRAILLNDAGARFVEATADVALASAMPALLEPAPAVAGLHPSAGGGGPEELLMVQVTRFACGSLAVGHTMSHVIADGQAACNFLLAWGQATRGVPIDPAPAHDRASLFLPRVPPRVEFEHHGVEFKAPPPPHGGKACNRSNDADDVVVVHRAHFTRELLSELRSRASERAPRPYSPTLCLMAHLWRCITRARGLDGGAVTRLRVAVNGRARMSGPPRVVPEAYTGNVVLWAWPVATARELVGRPLWHAAELVSAAVARVDERYFRSFVDFACSGAVEEEGLVTTADATEKVLSPDVEVDSLLHAAFYELDFGGGRPFFFMPGYLPEEGSVFVVRSFSGDGSVSAYVPLFSRAMDSFKKCCYSLSTGEARL